MRGADGFEPRISERVQTTHVFGCARALRFGRRQEEAREATDEQIDEKKLFCAAARNLERRLDAFDRLLDDGELRIGKRVERRQLHFARGWLVCRRRHVRPQFGENERAELFDKSGGVRRARREKRIDRLERLVLDVEVWRAQTVAHQIARLVEKRKAERQRLWNVGEHDARANQKHSLVDAAAIFVCKRRVTPPLTPIARFVAHLLAF